MNAMSISSATLLAAICCGCVSYGQREVAAMSSYEICALQVNQSWSLAEPTRQLLGAELQRRKEGCAAHQPAIQAQRAEDLYDRTYRNQSP